MLTWRYSLSHRKLVHMHLFKYTLNQMILLKMLWSYTLLMHHVHVFEGVLCYHVNGKQQCGFRFVWSMTECSQNGFCLLPFFNMSITALFICMASTCTIKSNTVVQWRLVIYKYIHMQIRLNMMILRGPLLLNIIYSVK